jgi:hypothetical protein
MIRDQAATLRHVIEQAGTAVDEGNRDAALATVEQRLDVVSRQLVLFGVAQLPWSRLLDPDARSDVAMAAAALEQTVKPLHEATDERLAVYGGSSGADGRGVLSAITRHGNQLSAALQDAQGRLLATWAEELWPGEKLSELEILTHVDETRGEAGQVLALSSELRDKSQETLSLSASVLERLEERRKASAALTQVLHDHPVPPDVLEFWREVSERDDETSLSTLSLDVHRWLVEHGAADVFTISKN